MATAEDVSKSIGYIRAQVDRCLTRCQNAPYSSSDRSRKIQTLQDEAIAISDRASEEIRRLEAPAQENFDRFSQDISAREEELAGLQRQQQSLQQVHQARNVEHTARVRAAASRGEDQGALNSQWQIITRDLQAATAEIGVKIAELQTIINELHVSRQKAQTRLNEDSARARREPATAAMLAAEEEMRALLDRAGLLEKEIAVGANVELIKEATATFGSRTGDFTEAEQHHKKQAWVMFAAMFIVLLLSAVAVYYLFIVGSFAHRSADVPALAPAGAAAAAASALIVERMVVLVAGRIAILLFLAWSVKYLADLHRVHAEQAVIYRDRKAALGIAELLLNATPELEQKRDMLRMLTTVYLNFDNSAFVKKRPESSAAETTVDGQIKRLKDTVDAVKPILEAAGKASDKTKS
ncbi:MAG: hypothetical protein U0325_25630 [Polyangiales bacterium]